MNSDVINTTADLSLHANGTKWTTMDDVTNTTICSNDYCVSDEEYVDMMLLYIWPSPSEWFLVVIYSFVFLIGVVGNFLVCYAVCANEHMRTVTNLFIVNLAIADCLVLLVCLPPTLLVDITETWYFGAVGCKIVQYLQGVSVSVSVLVLSFISVERWYAICYPLRLKSTLGRARLLMAAVWIVSGLIYVPELFVLDTHARYPTLTVLLTVCKPTWSNQSQSIYQLCLIIVLYVVPFLLMGFCYLRIARCLWANIIPTEERSRQPLRQTNGVGAKSAAEQQLLSRRKVAKMLIAVVVMFAVCYLPVHLLNILRYTGLLYSMDPECVTIFALVAHWMAYFNSAINPVIYNFMSEKFRRAFRTLLLPNCSKFRVEFRRVCCRRCDREGDRLGFPADQSRIYTYRFSQTEHISMKTVRHVRNDDF